MIEQIDLVHELFQWPPESVTKTCATPMPDLKIKKTHLQHMCCVEKMANANTCVEHRKTNVFVLCSCHPWLFSFDFFHLNFIEFSIKYSDNWLNVCHHIVQNHLSFEFGQPWKLSKVLWRFLISVRLCWTKCAWDNFVYGGIFYPKFISKYCWNIWYIKEAFFRNVKFDQ